jgi:hypothetical protein
VSAEFRFQKHNQTLFTIAYATVMPDGLIRRY